MRAMSGSASLDRQYLTTVTFSIIFAGHETTTNASAGAFRPLLENREQWERLCADPSLIPNAVEESLRFYPPVPQWRRITRKPGKVRGVDLPAGARLVLALVSANRDNGIFADGDGFNIQRCNADGPSGVRMATSPLLRCRACTSGDADCIGGADT
jgi:cytochrome P450